jgi:hypothetical protein
MASATLIPKTPAAYVRPPTLIPKTPAAYVLLSHRERRACDCAAVRELSSALINTGPSGR